MPRPAKGPARLCGLRLCGVGITLRSRTQPSKRQSRVSARVWRVSQPCPTRKRGPKGDDAMCPNTLGASGKAEPAVGTSVNPCLCGDQAVPSISNRGSLLVLSLSLGPGQTRRDRYSVQIAHIASCVYVGTRGHPRGNQRCYGAFGREDRRVELGFKN